MQWYITIRARIRVPIPVQYWQISYYIYITSQTTQTIMPYVDTKHTYRYSVVFDRYHMTSNLGTGLTVAAGMIGSVTLVLPALFKEEGIISCLIVMVLMALVYCRTCQLWMIHWVPGEEDISQIVKRTLGMVWFIVLGVSSGLLLLLISVIYFLLLNKTMYPVVTFVLESVFHTDKFHDGTDGVHFQVFSIQYLGFIVLLCLLPLYNLRSIDGVVKFAKYGVVFLIIYFLTLVGMFATTVAQHGFHPEKVKLMATTFDGWVEIAGQFSLAFISHNTIITFTKDNKDRNEIPKAIAYGFGVAAVLYTLFGVFGGMALTTEDYFKKSPFLEIIGGCIFLYIVSIYGIFPFVSRTQFFCWRQTKDPLPKMWFYGFNLLMVLTCGTFQTLNISPGIVIAITGTGVGIITCFALPIWIHLRCYRPRQTTKESIITQTSDYLLAAEGEEGPTTAVLVPSETRTLLPPWEVKCVPHTSQKVPFSARVFVCSVLLLIGVTNFGFQVKLMIQ